MSAPELADDDPVTGAVVDAVGAGKGGDPLAPVTVVTPSPYAAILVRRTLGSATPAADRRGVTNVTCTTVDGLVKMLGTPELAARGLRLVPPPVDREAIRACALTTASWVSELAVHPRALETLHRACDELRRCPAPTLDGFARRPGRAGELARLLVAVRQRLHERGFADHLDLRSAAAEVAARGGAEVGTLGPLVVLAPGALAPGARAVLDLVAARNGATELTVPADAGCTEVVACTDPDEEARAAVRAVIAGARRGVPLWRQAILHPAGPVYGRVLHQQLAAAGLAVHGPELRRLERSVSGATLLGALELAAGDWPREQVAAWLSAAPLVWGPHRRPVPAGRWDALSAHAGIVRGATQWQERLRHLAARQPALADDAGALAGFMAELTARATAAGGSWAELAAWAVGLLDHYLDAPTGSWPPEDVAAAEQVRGAVLGLADLDAVSGAVDAPTFRRAVQMLLGDVPIDVRDLTDGGFGDGVFVAPFGQARGMRFHTVVLVGLADAVVPGRVGEDALLPDDARRLDTSGGLRTRAARLEAAHDDLRAALGAGAARRVALYPRVDPRTGRAHVPSRWLAALAPPAPTWGSVDSFAAAVAAADPPLSVAELELHRLDRWAAQGADALASPVAVASPRLATGIRAARARLGPQFTRFDGRVGRGRVSPFDPEAPVSATRLEAYARCPRRFLFEKVLALRARTLPEELWHIEPVDRGTLVHRILEDYVVERVNGAPRSLDRLLEIADGHCDDAEAAGRVGKALLWRMDRAAIRRDLARFHQEEEGLVPQAAELEFGTEGAAAAVCVVLDDGREVRFKGKADRIDRTAAGQLVVSDYKTGRQSGLRALTKDPLAGGTLLQLPIYALAAEQSFGAGATVLARYWLLSSERSAPSYHLLVTDEVQDRFRHVLGLIARAVDAGAFPGAPGATQGDRQFEACRFCDFDRLCPPDRDRQWARKVGSPGLATVADLFDAEVPDGLAHTVVRGLFDPDEMTA